MGRLEGKWKQTFDFEIDQRLLPTTDFTDKFSENDKAKNGRSTDNKKLDSRAFSLVTQYRCGQLDEASVLQTRRTLSAYSATDEALANDSSTVFSDSKEHSTNQRNALEIGTEMNVNYLVHDGISAEKEEKWDAKKVGYCLNYIYCRILLPFNNGIN